jgi:hypothetical protein
VCSAWVVVEPHLHQRKQCAALPQWQILSVLTTVFGKQAILVQSRAPVPSLKDRKKTFNIVCCGCCCCCCCASVSLLTQHPQCSQRRPYSSKS